METADLEALPVGVEVEPAPFPEAVAFEFRLAL